MHRMIARRALAKSILELNQCSEGMLSPAKRSRYLPRASNLHGRGLGDFVDRFCQSRLELGIAHRVPEVFDECARKAHDHAVVGGEALAGDVARIAAGESHYPRHERLFSQ